MFKEPDKSTGTQQISRLMKFCDSVVQQPVSLLASSCPLMHIRVQNKMGQRHIQIYFAFKRVLCFEIGILPLSLLMGLTGYLLL